MRRTTIALAVGLLAAPLAAHAQTSAAGAGNPAIARSPAQAAAPQQTIDGRPLVDAPTAGPPPGEPPEYRVASPGSRDLNAGPVSSTPFSAGPLDNSAAGSPGSPNGAPGDTFLTPNLNK